MRIMSLDFETSIGKTIHDSKFRDPNNDIYTQIWAKHPNQVHVNHSIYGYKRLLDVCMNLNKVDVLVGHSLQFDLAYIWNDPRFKQWLINGGQIWDTMQAEYHLTGQDAHFVSLADLQLKYLGENTKPSRISYLYKKGIGADKILAKKDKCPRLFKLYEQQYCTSDGRTPLLIFKEQYRIAKEKGMLEFIKLYNDYLLGIINMTCTGIPIDIIAAEKTERDFNLKALEYAEQAENILKETWKDARLPRFNISSTQHKSAVLFGGHIKINTSKLIGNYKNGNPRYKKVEELVFVKGLGVDVKYSHPMKAAGFYCTDDKVMQNIEKAYPSGKIAKYCELQRLAMTYKKCAITYCRAFINRNVGGILYPNFNTTITPTGRLSSSEPNMQNIPSKGKFAKILMGLLIAPSGWKCVSIDFSQLEKWTQAWMSGDMNLTRELIKGTCLHCKTLAALEGLDYEYVYQKAKIEEDPIWDKKRTRVKPVGFLMDYGGMEKRVSAETGLSMDEVQKLFAIDKELYPQKWEFFENTLPGIVNLTSREYIVNNEKQLLPIFDNKGNICYNEKIIQKIGYWKTSYGKLYSFKDSGRYTKYGLRRGFSMPQFKNYPNQGGGSDIQAATTAALLKVLLEKSDKIKMISEIHDSKMFLIREDVLDPCLHWLKNTIENVPKIFKERFGINVPFKFPVSIDVGNNFGEMTSYKL